MYKIVRNVIEAGKYELTDMLAKVDTLWMQGSLTDDERLELIKMARSKADPANTFAPLQDQIDALAARVKALEGAEDAPGEEYPTYVQPTGSHDAYHAGDKVTFQGKRYVCTAPEGVAVVWDPVTYPTYWQEITE